MFKMSNVSNTVKVWRYTISNMWPCRQQCVVGKLGTDTGLNILLHAA